MHTDNGVYITYRYIQMVCIIIDFDTVLSFIVSYMFEQGHLHFPFASNPPPSDRHGWKTAVVPKYLCQQKFEINKFTGKNRILDVL